MGRTNSISDLEFNKFDSKGHVKIAKQDQITEIVDLHLSIYIDDLVVTANTALDDKVISVTCNTLPVVGNSVCLKEGSAFYQGDINVVTPTGGTGYDLTLAEPLDYAFTTAGGCSLRSRNLAVNGSVTPVIANVSPKGLTVDWDITRVLLSLTDATAMDDGTFGGIAGGLTNGVVFRRIDGTWKNLFAAKTNGDLAAHAYDVQYIDNTLGPGGLYGLRMRRSFNGDDKNGVAIRLVSSSDDEFQLIIQDDLTGLNDMQCIVQGHVVDKS